MQKLFEKERERERERVEKRKRIEKIDKCPRYLKQWVLRCPPEKKEKEKKR